MIKNRFFSMRRAHHARQRGSRNIVKNQRCKHTFCAFEMASKRADSAYMNQFVTVGFRTAVYPPVIREDENEI